MRVKGIAAEVMSRLDGEIVTVKGTEFEHDRHQHMAYLVGLALLVGFAFGLKVHVLVFALLTAGGCLFAFVADLVSGATFGRAVIETIMIGVALQAGYAAAFVVRALR